MMRSQIVLHGKRLFQKYGFNAKFIKTNISSRTIATINTSTAEKIILSKPATAPKSVAYWLFGVSGLVAGMVTVGGITRLTKSGLSMTDWKLQGSMPPITTEEWDKEFERYKQYPEWQQRQSMTLREFQFIYFWEYAHRMMGRGIGLAFVLPGVYFAARGMIPRSMYPRVGLLFTLGGGQGLIGWWMVRSGLNLDPSQRKEIRVSPYRLATHLSMAFTTYVLLLWTGLEVLHGQDYKMKQLAATMSKDTLHIAKGLRGLAGLNAALAAITVLSGAYVAGNDAGNAFNTFPKMNDEWIPSEILEMEPKWRNFFENTATVQFDHRVLALTTLTGISSMYAIALQSAKGAFWSALPTYARTAFHLVAGMAVAQVSLGISTLLLYVPIELAATHQAGSLVLMSFLTVLLHSLGFAKHGSSSSVSTMRATVAASSSSKIAPFTAAFNLASRPSSSSSHLVRNIRRPHLSHPSVVSSTSFSSSRNNNITSTFSTMPAGAKSSITAVVEIKRVRDTNSHLN